MHIGRTIIIKELSEESFNNLRALRIQRIKLYIIIRNIQCFIRIIICFHNFSLKVNRTLSLLIYKSISTRLKLHTKSNKEFTSYIDTFISIEHNLKPPKKYIDQYPIDHIYNIYLWVFLVLKNSYIKGVII